jgi:hypothetical protein
MESWKTMVQLTPRGIRLLMTDSDRNELLKAVLPAFPQHPRALLSCLEGLALWSGHTLSAVISAGPTVDRRCAEALFGDGLLPLDSALVRFDYRSVGGRRRTISGLGDFRQLRLAGGRVA